MLSKYGSTKRKTLLAAAKARFVVKAISKVSPPSMKI